jgi:hypothetical protein
MPPSVAVLYKRSPRPVRMETLNSNSRPSVKDVEVDAQLRNELAHEGPRAAVPESLRMDSMNFRLTGTSSSVCERLFLIPITDESCGDPTVKPSSADLSRLWEGEKMIGCIEGDMDAILMTVSYSSSACSPHRTSCAGLSFLSCRRGFHLGKLQHVFTRLVRSDHAIIHPHTISISATH